MTTPPQNQTELKKSIEEASSISFWGQLSESSVNQFLLAANRLKEVEKDNEEASEAFEQLASSFPAIQVDCNTPIEAAQFINGEYEKLAKELSQLRASYDAVNSRMIETICERDQLRTEYKKALEVLKHWKSHKEIPCPTSEDEQEQVGEDFTNVWFETESALSTPSAIAVMKGDKV